jgi:hypothetical protein
MTGLQAGLLGLLSCFAALEGLALVPLFDVLEGVKLSRRFGERLARSALLGPIVINLWLYMSTLAAAGLTGVTASIRGLPTQDQMAARDARRGPGDRRRRGGLVADHNGVKELIDQILVSHLLVHALDSTESLPLEGIKSATADPASLADMDAPSDHRPRDRPIQPLAAPGSRSGRGRSPSRRWSGLLGHRAPRPHQHARPASTPPIASISETAGMRKSCSQGIRWAREELNLRPLPCQIPRRITPM